MLRLFSNDSQVIARGDEPLTLWNTLKRNIRVNSKKKRTVIKSGSSKTTAHVLRQN
jgi:hypothetical protein